MLSHPGDDTIAEGSGDSMYQSRVRVVFVFETSTKEAEMAAVPGFTPSVNGFHFPNSWPQVAAFDILVLGQSIEIGNAQRGLCGGMVFAARDFFEHQRPVPAETTAPGAGPIYHYIGDRLRDSFDLPLGPTKYLDLMAAPDGDRGIPWISRLLGRRSRGVGWRAIHDELPKIVADIDGGHLSCLGLICVSGLDPRDLGHNHQVLAYRYERTATVMRIWVYDPNRPDRDDVYLQFSTAAPTKATPIAFVNGSQDVRGFFRAAYRRVLPPL
jgi:hypothetical protein